MTGALDGRVALVTAGSRGIGRGVVEGFLAEGASVVLTGRSEDKGKQALAELGVGGRAHFVSGDAASRSDIDNWVAATLSKYGRLDFLVNNVGGSDGFALVHEMTDDAWLRAHDLILHSAFRATRAAIPAMLEVGGGRIVNISSVEGKVGNKATVSHYITAKHAMNGFTKAVAFEYGDKNITCNAICPGAIETDLMMEVGPKYAAENGISYEEYKAAYAKDSAIGRLNTVEEVAAMTALLCGPAGGGITGALINVDGGTAPY
ncbi:3-oxoacyl-ACP reductase [Gordonia paraffinivorans]|uniref:SDR family NAD(P)-dependent oxidoreductase n=1 Tax=Gordonia paraffinivorans TaxID=175628 RepID=UPI000D60EE25|nr:SDR family NAD(P)-dependent oxidoreductase [Gordonia paraffinivorans]MBY4576004.1 3-oxoacyl-ACP reductase [Gordonia paraffinivorans]PWD41496.1 3-oxoacyl-ACP reductase [Gordonia paraffinivorans]